ncbi:MAG: AsmA family protein, partial [Ginsengibacter sp.]
MKKVFKYTGIVLLVFILLLFFIPIVFKSKIVSLVKKEINKNIEATVNFSDVSLSVFRHFPKLSIALENISVIGLNEYKGDTLLSAPAVDASVNIMSVIKGKDMKVYGVYLQSPRIHALVNKEGKANWDIAKEDTSSSSPGEPSAFKLNLKKYEIKDGYVSYKDEQAGMSAEITGLDHEGSGNFTEDIFTLSTKTKTQTASFTYANIDYLVN